MRHLQQIHATYRDRGVVVLGLNRSDDKDIAKQFLDDNGATFPTVLESSAAAHQVMAKYETFGMSAVPLTYVIDRDGKVAGAWYGFSGNHDEGLRLLRKLGVE